MAVLAAIGWVVRMALFLAALYIFFPPLWDAAFAGNLKTLHDAPYIAAERARHLWHLIVDRLDYRGLPPPPQDKPARES